jgi:hypothetical protein
MKTNNLFEKICRKFVNQEHNLDEVIENYSDYFITNGDYEPNNNYFPDKRLSKWALSELTFAFYINKIISELKEDEKEKIEHNFLENAKKICVKNAKLVCQSREVNPNNQRLSLIYTNDESYPIKRVEYDYLSKIDGLPIFFEIKSGQYRFYSKTHGKIRKEIAMELENKIIDKHKFINRLFSTNSGCGIVVPKDSYEYMRKDRNYISFLIDKGKGLHFNLDTEDFLEYSNKYYLSKKYNMKNHSLKIINK